MNLLIDSHVFVWTAFSDRRLSRRAIEALANADNQIRISVVTRWELAAKQRRHAAFALPEPFDRLLHRAGYQPLDLEFDVPRQLETMPDIHGDPFDRMLVAQALHHGLTLVTDDHLIRRYPVETLW